MIHDVPKYPAAIFARMTSSRLPGKVLLPLAGKPLLRYVIDTLRHCQSVSEIIIATSDHASDDPLQAFASANGLECLRGSLKNAAARLGLAIRRFRTEAIYRVNGDSPLVSSELLVTAAKAFRAGQHDIVTNIFPRTFPAGMSVELIRCATYENALAKITSTKDREHVTSFLYRLDRGFRVHNIACTTDCSDIHLAVDTIEHLDAIERFVSTLKRPHWQYSANDIITRFRGT